jgi:hypothetical protein
MLSYLDLKIDLRPVDTLHAVSALKKFLEVMEEQIHDIEVNEVSRLEAKRPPGNDAEQQSIHSGYVSQLENLFENELIPTMRYSFIVFLHTVFETRLSHLCRMIGRERSLPHFRWELRERPIEKAQTYLTKHAGVSVADYPEWNDLGMFQKIRNCIVHHYGFLNLEDGHHQDISDFAKGDPDIEITHQGRFSPGAKFCIRQHAKVDSFFRQLMSDFGWQV